LAADGFLTPEEVAQYREQGFLVPRFRLDDEDFARVKADVLALIEAHPEGLADAIIQTHMPQPPGVPTLMPFCLRPEILNMVESLDGPDLMLWNASIFHRPAAQGGYSPFHQDGEYWPIDPRATTSVWVAMTDCRPDSGCLRLIPGSHKHIARHVDAGYAVGFSKNLAPDAYDETDAVDIVLAPGEMVLFDIDMIHGSHRNDSGEDRTGLVLRYCPTTSFFDRNAGDRDPRGKLRYEDQGVFVVRGVNRNPRNDVQQAAAAA
jgi:hypothetical protein